MPSETLVSVREARERAIALLTEQFAEDRLELEEFERRVNLVHRAPSVAEVEKITADLSTLPALALPQQTALVPAGEVREEQSFVAFFGGLQRKGTWTAARYTRITCVFGGAELDFRDARLPPGVTEVSIFALFGGAQIIVPPELAVEVSGSAVFGGFAHLERSSGAPDPDRPLLRVTGFAMMGGVSVDTRIPGEGERDARRRRRRERKLQSRSSKKALPPPAEE